VLRAVKVALWASAETAIVKITATAIKIRFIVVGFASASIHTDIAREHYGTRFRATHGPRRSPLA